MAKASPHRLSAGPLGRAVLLGRALRRPERVALARSLRNLLSWQSTLKRFPQTRGGPDATPYVSLYAAGKLRGCYGSHEGAPSKRLVRAFLLALSDVRYGGVSATERKSLAADVAFITHARPVRADEAVQIIEPGTHGIALFADRATVLLPSVARERGYSADGMLDLLARKAAQPRSSEGIVWVLDVEEVSSQMTHDADPARAVRRFLEALMGRDGALAFEMDAGSGEVRSSGLMRHARIAVAIEALGALVSQKTRAARAWLSREIGHGLGGLSPEGWPDRPDRVLGTLALAARAGIDVPLVQYAATVDAKTCSAWHAAQAASVLGARTPPALWAVCVRALETSELSPYALMAARARGEAAIVERCARALAASVRTDAPFRGGAAFTDIPETALTAVTIEALAPMRDQASRRAVRDARAFVLARQVLDLPASMHPRALGAFRASSITPILRCDIAGHAALALTVSA